MPDPINWSLSWPYFSIAFIFGYFLGSIPFGYLLAKLSGFGDIRTIGSGNIGATNVLRAGSKILAGFTLLGDMLKGTVAVFLAGRYGPDTAVIAGLAAFLGHLYPIWLTFKGGKGVATYLGLLLGLSWLAALVFAVIWLICAWITRFSSLSALVAALCAPLFLAISGYWQWAELFSLLTVLLWWKHRDNIRRLIQGRESKIGKKSDAKPPS